MEIDRVKSTHIVEVVPVLLEKHPDPETTSLSVVKVFGGYTVVVNTAQWAGIDRAAYIPPDSLVDTTMPEFAFLANGKSKLFRVSVKRLRGVYSQGCLVPVNSNVHIGTDVTEALRVQHYEPEIPCEYSTNTDSMAAPEGYKGLPKFDVDSGRRYHNLLTQGEQVYISEKVHGQCSNYVFTNGEMNCRARSEWKKENEKCTIWRALKNTPMLEKFCRENPDVTVYGEVYGQQKNFKYGLPAGDVGFAAFDIMNKDFTFLNPGEFISVCDSYYIPTVPQIGVHEFSLDKCLEMAEGITLMNDKHVREGVVVRPKFERQDMRLGRVILKFVGNGYLSVK